MLYPGNAKLGRHLIWSFSLPSGRADVCVGMTPACRKVCYSRRLESYRSTAARRYAVNLRLARKPGFVKRIRAHLIANHIRILRIHAGGEFMNANYARRWLMIIERTPKVRFFTYTRSWRLPAIRAVLNEMASLSNLQLWFSTDRDTGWPESVPAGVRIAWLMTTTEDVPPRPVDLVFRVQSLRHDSRTEIEANPICPAEDGVVRDVPVTCDRCRTCWRPPLPQSPNPDVRHRSLPLVETSC